ncbi:beta strand repeat-containing protein [Rubripirellula reticaptiva]|uniref:Autotransporter-associated beta strand repeat protein n=1 Tax=Rubripirellula reticaptiva TaxID=2528013 RepID=A0A5C6EJ73_9BACT|nr:YDG domain-containing protein [Rubripirellula reticaptiva]TWU48137.1 Autotransporter-associated beta strand repeat protein [Rubripirellula reticaptiva]
MNIGDNGSSTNPLTIGGGLNVYGGVVSVSKGITSTGTGDIFLQGATAANASLNISGNILKTGGAASTLTLKGAGRVTVNNAITATNPGGMNVVLWSDYDGGDQGGVSILNSISTGGGHFWAGGSDTVAGSNNWNGLTVGNGPSVGGNGYNHNALDLYGNITTAGGDVLLWGGNGYSTGTSGLGVSGARTIDSGSGDVTLIADDVVGGTIEVNSTGHFTYKPNSNTLLGVGGQLDFDGNFSGSSFIGTGDTNWLRFTNYSALGGLTLGTSGMTNNIRVFDTIDVNGRIELYGADLIIDAGVVLDSTGGGTAADIVLHGSGSVTVPEAIISGGGVDIHGNTVSLGSSIQYTGDASIISDNGDLNFYGNLEKYGGAESSTLLKSSRHIVLNSGASLLTSSGTQNVKLWADSDNSGDGINIFSSPTIATNGGSFTVGNGNTASIGGSTVKVGGDIYINGSSAQTINTNGGDLTINGETIAANTNGVTFESAGGNIVFGGVLNSGNQYTYVDGPDGQANSWDWARANAKNGTAGGAALGDSYMATITSRLENAIAGIAAGYRGAWIGAYRDTATPNDWVWADGPEAGQHFFTQGGSGGGSPESGWYANFGTGEPNGTGTTGETRGQFFGNAGQWNDLGSGTTFAATQDSDYAVLGYVRETNLAPTMIAINAGSGTVTFDGGVGSSKALASLAVTAGAGIHINGGQVKTEGIQTYNSPVVLGNHTHFSTIQNDIFFNSTVDSDDVANQWNLTATITPSNVYHWVDWSTWDEASKTATGTITVGSDVIIVTYHNPQGIFEAQTSGGTNYWTGRSGGAFVGDSPYISSNVANGPSTSDIIKLAYAGSQTLTFSESVENLAFSIMSMNGNGYGFDQDFTIESYSGLNGASPGYFGAGTLSKSILGDTFQLNDGGVNVASDGGNSEPHGTIRFGNAFSTLTWDSLSNETWNAFSIGVSGTSATAGRVQFGGAVGSNAAVGDIAVNAAVRTTANIAAASSFDVTGLTSLGGDITTTGNQTFGSAVTLDTDLALTTTANGNVKATGTIDGAHDLSVETNGTGDVTIGGSVGGNNALTNLTIDTVSLDAQAISLADDAALAVTNSGASEIAGVISGTDATLTKDGAASLTLSGTNTYSGSTTVSGGTLSITTDANLGTAPSTTTQSHLTLDGGALLVTANTTLSSNRGMELGNDGGTIEIATGTTTQYAGIIAGSGDLTKSGAGILKLSGQNTYTGATTVSGGIAETSHASALGNNSAVTLNNTAGVTLNLLSELAIGSLTGGGTTGGNVSLGTSTLTIGDDGTSTTFGGGITGTGGLNKNGTSEFTATGLATYTGSTAVAAGSIVFQNNAAPLTSGFTGSGTVTIEPSGTSFSSGVISNYHFANTLSGLMLGKSGNTSEITVNSVTSINGDVAIHAGNLAIINTLATTAGNTTTLGVSGNATQTTAITTDNLALQGTGNFTLDNNANSVGTLAGGETGTLLGNLAFVNNAILTVGTVGSQTGIAASGTVNLATQSGDLTITQNVATTNTTASAITLNAGRSTSAGTASGGNLILSNSHSITVGTGGRATFYTGGIADSLGLTDAVGSGSGRFRYNSDEADTNYSLSLGTGPFGIYREQPSITITAIDASTTYGTAPTLTTSIDSQNGDTAAQAFSLAPTITVGGDQSTSGNFIAGDHSLTASGGTSQLGYAINGYSGGTLTVNQKPISVPVVVDNKVYDGSTTAQMNATSSGVVATDVVTIGGTATFANKNVGTGKTVNITGLNLTGTDAANYSLASTTDTSTADITPLSINVTGLTGENKVYDGTTLAALSGTATTAPIVGDDLQVVGSAIASFADKNVGTSKSIVVSGLSLAGDDANNYNIIQPSGLAADITPAPLTIIANNDAKFVTKMDLAGYAGASYRGFVAGEDISNLTGSLSVLRSGIGSDESAGIYADALAASGWSSSNYDITYVTGDYTIVPADQLLVRFDNSSSTYGDLLGLQLLSAQYMDTSETVHTLTPTSAVNGHYAFDDGVGGTAAFDVVLDGSSLSTSNYTNAGAFALGMENLDVTSGNFSNSVSIVGNHTVNRAAINVSASGVSKTYEGNTAMVNLSLDQTGDVNGDVLTLNGQGSYADRHAGTGLAYTVGNLELGGTDANNYYLTVGSTFTANDGVITPKNVTITAPPVAKVYDGNTNSVATTPQLQAFTTALGITGDSVASITLTYDDKNVGTDKTLTASNIAINDGNGGGNYNITFTDNADSSITRLGTVTWIGGTTGNWNDPANWAGGAVPDLANVANVIIPQGVTPTFDNSVNGPVEIDSLLGGNLQVDSGTLNVDGSLDVDTFTQDGGTVTAGTFHADDVTQNDGVIEVDGNFTVHNSFTQSSTGTIDVTGDVDITQTSGDLTVNNLSGGNVKLDGQTGGVNLHDLTATGNLVIDAAGDITQSSTGTITVGETTTLTAGGNIDLDGTNNDFAGPVHATGHDINLVDGHGGLTLGNIDANGDFDATSTDGDITQHPGTTVQVDGETTLAGDGDVILGNIGNVFTGIVNVLADNGIIRQSTGDLLLGNVQTTGDFTTTANNGSVGQSPTSTIDVAGNSSFTAKTAINLPNAGNRLGQQTTVNAPRFELNSLDPLDIIRTGAALGDSALSKSVSDTTNDTFTRPASASQTDPNSGANTGQRPNGWFETFKMFVTNLVTRGSDNSVNGQAEGLSAEQTGDETYLRRQGPT